jgi:hypothetical protein
MDDGDGATSIGSFFNLFMFAPGLQQLTSTIVNGNPGAIASNATQVASLGQTLQGHGQDLTKHAEDTKSFWSGPAAGATFDALFTVGTAIGDHAGQIGHYASTGLKLANDFKQLVNVVNNGQKMADAVVAMLSKIPMVGHAAAQAYALKTAIWTGLCAAQLVNIGQDVANLISGLHTKSVQQAYTPPPHNPMPTPATPAVTQRQGTQPFGASA